ncbi:MAG: hypothetical protein HY717_11855 [Planctomycetes bacterium]|nr:hypothetical protein [Planctomycetota bacterium]
MCVAAHNSCVHLGLLKIEGNPFTGLAFRRKSIPALADFQLALKELSRVPEIRLEVKSGIDGLGRNGANRRHSAIADSAIAGAPGSPYEGLLKALGKIGYSRTEALKRLRLAREKLAAAGGKEPAEGELRAVAQERTAGGAGRHGVAGSEARPEARRESTETEGEILVAAIRG